MPSELEAFIDEMLYRARQDHYVPSEFIRMRAQYGTVGAISRLVRSGHIQSGFRRLCSLGLREWTIESAVLRFRDQFRPADIECATFRLQIAA